MSALKIRGAEIYDTEKQRFFAGGMIIEDGKIVKIGDVGEGEDMRGARIVPGMVDVHTHGRIGHDFCGASPDEVIRMCASYASVGTTTVFATIATATYDEMCASLENIRSAAARKNAGVSANIDGIHIEGRYINIKRRGAHNPDLLAPLSNDEIRHMLGLISPLGAHVTCAPELEGGEGFVRTAVSCGATVGIGHTDATFEQALEAIGWGATSFTHTYNAMSPLNHRAPGVVGAALYTDDAYAELICDGFHINPAVIKITQKAKNPRYLVLITDSMEATGMGDGEYGIAGCKVYVKDGLARGADGVISGSTLDLWRGVRNFMRFCDIPLEQALPYATINPARMVGIDSVCGSLCEGKRADFLVLGDDNSISRVCVGGCYIA